MKRFSRLCLLLLCIAPIKLTFAANDYVVTELSPNIYYHQGVHEDATEQNVGAIANVSFIIGDKCVAVIDSGGSYMEGRYLRQAIAEKTELPVCYVINTHVHPDHILGNAAFSADKPIYIGHSKLAAAIDARKSHFERVFKEYLGATYTGTEFIAPTKTVEVGKPIELDLGNKLLTLTAYTTAHTDNDLTVFDQTTKTLWTGDLLFIERIPAMDGSINGWINIMNEMLTWELNCLIPGHGTPTHANWQEAIKNQLRYFSSMRDQIRLIIADLGTIEQATHSVGLEEKSNWELFDAYHRRNITASFVELEWE